MILFSVNCSLEASSGKLLHSVWILMNSTLIMDSLSISKLWYCVVWWSIRRAVSCCLQCLRYCSQTLVREAGVLDIPNLQVGIHPFGNCPLLIMTLCPFPLRMFSGRWYCIIHPSVSVEDFCMRVMSVSCLYFFMILYLLLSERN